jgi:hypothetical protein
MVAAPEYSLATQAKLVSAICIIHNFARIYDPDTDEDDALTLEVERRSPQRERDEFGGHISHRERDDANARRDEIANAMWAQYVAHNAEF